MQCEVSLLVWDAGLYTAFKRVVEAPSARDALVAAVVEFAGRRIVRIDSRVKEKS